MSRSVSVLCLFSWAVLLVTAAVVQAATVTIYTDKTEWENALTAPFLTEDFSDEQLNAGVSFVSTESGHINPALGFYQDVLASESQNEPTTTWSFAPEITAYGGNWTLGGPGGSGNSLLVYVNDFPVYVGAISNSYGGGFWGFISDTPFTSVQLIGGSGIHQQNYQLDNMVYSPIELTEVAGRYLFYNNSAFDASSDDAAIAVDKVPLSAGSSATFANYSSYSRGINGLIVDIDRLANPDDLTPDDFAFRVGNDNDLSTWMPLTTSPSMTLLPGQGTGGSDRVVFVWPDGTIQNQWLETTVLANETTGLVTADVFYFGNAIGETGNRSGDTMIDATDLIGVRNHPRGLNNPATIDIAYDFNRDGTVDVGDLLLARDGVTSPLETLRLISIPASVSTSPAPMPQAVPEPSALLLLLAGTIGGSFLLWRGTIGQSKKSW